MNKKKIHVRVRRKGSSDVEPPYHQDWYVPRRKGVSVLDVLRQINEDFNGELAYYASCRIGICRGCLAKVNGKTVKICTEMATKDFTIEPLHGFPVIRDLVVDTKRKQNQRDEERDNADESTGGTKV